MKYPSTQAEAECLKEQYRCKSPIERTHSNHGSKFPEHCEDCKHWESYQAWIRTSRPHFHYCGIYAPEHQKKEEWPGHRDAWGRWEAR